MIDDFVLFHTKAPPQLHRSSNQDLMIPPILFSYSRSRRPNPYFKQIGFGGQKKRKLVRETQGKLGSWVVGEGFRKLASLAGWLVEGVCFLLG